MPVSKVIKERLKQLRGLMKKAGMDAYYIPSTDPHQSEYVPACWQRRQWLSGFTGSAGDLVVTRTTAGLWTDGRYFLQAEKFINDCCKKTNMRSLRPLLITAALATGLSVLVSGCSDDDIITADQKVPKDTSADYRPDQKQGSDGYDGGVPDKPKPDMREDVGLSCEVGYSDVGGKFAAVCTTKKSTCYGTPVQIGVKSHNLQYKNGKALTFICSEGVPTICMSHETLNNPQNYTVEFVAKGGKSSCGHYKLSGKIE